MLREAARFPRTRVLRSDASQGARVQILQRAPCVGQFGVESDVGELIPGCFPVSLHGKSPSVGADSSLRRAQNRTRPKAQRE
jgi:hypothetical protein